MSISSIPQPKSKSQIDHETPLQMFRRLLPRTIVAADRDAMGLRCPFPKARALGYSEICPNTDERVIFIIVDADAAPVYEVDPLTGELVRVNVAATSWIDAGLPPPNLIIENPKTGHAHLVWILEDPLILSTQTRALRYAQAIQRAMTRAIGERISYAWPMASMHNPFSERYTVREVCPTPYRLDTLAAGLDLAAPPREFRVIGRDDVIGLPHGQRNDGLFWHLMNAAAPRLMSRCKTEGEYIDSIMDYAADLNATFQPPMDGKELQTVASRVATIYRPYVQRDRAAELKAQRHAEGRTREAYEAPTREREREAHRLRALGLTIAQIAERLGVVIRTVKRYLSRAIDMVIGVIPIQGNVPCEPGRNATSTPEEGKKVMQELADQANSKSGNVIDGVLSPWSRLYRAADATDARYRPVIQERVLCAGGAVLQVLDASVRGDQAALRLLRERDLDFANLLTKLLPEMERAA